MKAFDLTDKVAIVTGGPLSRDYSDPDRLKIPRAAHGRHLNIRNNAGCVAEVGRPQEVLGRRKCMHGVTERT
jgi:hypothetical protein